MKMEFFLIPHTKEKNSNWHMRLMESKKIFGELAKSLLYGNEGNLIQVWKPESMNKGHN